ncbi:ATP-binding protein [Mycetocola spongiae]|uniref:ATP-binding protein n=1 Tax=Mycetocola spongiae TaxID=2859226 RepID=UPI001CF1B981|nr:ATP-binding protein [Mycetocola spongiae]UCR89653.1 hypothetical protein KXZ72_02900 [Mycetocola spongiae]
MSDAPLFHINGATEGTTQWRAETFQLVNWGGFQGHHSMDFSAEATLLSGASGSGKSTLLDAYLALMMPSDTAFNGASNDATTGRARGADQRNLLSYLKGKTDTLREEDTGEMRDAVLRGAESSTWGAIAMTFVDDNGRRYTVLRTYFVPRGATASSEVSMKMAVVDGSFDLRQLEGIAETRFDRRALKSLGAGIDVCASYLEFAQKLHTRLGIGAGGDGGKALRLLARIQAGQQVRTVDGLYKSMVLERPSTYAAADKALAHFADLEKSYDAMVTEDSKARVLAPIVELHAEFERAGAEAATIDTFGVHREGATPFTLWRLHAERDLLDAAAEVNALGRRETRERAGSAREQEDTLTRRLAELQKQQRENGGDVLEVLGAELAVLGHRHEQVRAERSDFLRRTAPLGLALDTREEFLVAQGSADLFLSGFEENQRALEAERDVIKRAQYPLEEEKRALRAEEKSLAGREGLVPERLHAARLLIARAAGMDPAELPFVAELLDIAPEQEHWRTAAEVTLGSVARLLLVDETRLDALSRAIDGLDLPTRIGFEGVPLGGPAQFTGDPARISGKLIFKDSPFTAWVAERVGAPHTDALCVEDAAQLGGGGPRVTASGQTRDGKRGAHGDVRDRHIIGFSNTVRLAEIAAEISALDERLAENTALAGAVGARMTQLRQVREAHLSVRDAKWATIDVAAVAAEISEQTAERERILAGSDILRELNAEEDRLILEREGAQREKHLAESEAARLGTDHATLVDRQDAVSAEIEEIEIRQDISLSEEHARRLDEEFAAVGDAADYAAFAAGIRRLRERLLGQSQSATDAAARAQNGLIQIFQTYQERWPDPNLGTGVVSYPGYLEILTGIHTTGLHARRGEWTRRLAEWSGQDLVPLGGAFDGAVEAIEERLGPVNDILETLPFGAGRDRLSIVLRRLANEDVHEFRRELRVLSSAPAEVPSDEQAEERFARLRAFMDRIRETTGGGTSQRDLLLDVRRHVEITAVRSTVDGVEISTYSSLGGKSGGESQELVAFIVGAALRFQLGDESRTRPRFAPVFLDEGFVKSDSEFAGRAVAAWKGLGFQLIVGAPLDKVTALEPYMQSMLSMTKNNATGYSYITELTGVRG